MDKQIIMLYAKKLKYAIIILVVGLACCGALINFIIPKIQQFVAVNKDIHSQTKSIETNEKKLADLKVSMQQKVENQAEAVKEFFKPIETGLDAEAVMSEAFGDILTMLRNNSVKARSLKYDYNPSSDKFVKNASNKYHVCSLNLETIATYKQLQLFLKDLYKHEHFLEISDVEILPYQKDKKILLAKINIKLYSQKSEGAAEGAVKATSAQKNDTPKNNVTNQQPAPQEEPSNDLMTPPPGDVPDIQ